MSYLDGPVEWVSFTDAAHHTTWLFDLTFLTSGWHCTFGTTCKGTEPGDNGARGCCAHGAHLVDGERERIVERAAMLDETMWQNRSLVVDADDLFDLVDGEEATRREHDACIFLNAPDFDGGHGCALHIGALAAGERPIDWKPAVCWQVPFRYEEFVDDSGTVTMSLRAWRRTDWGEGGDDFGWWCTEELVPAGGDAPQTWQSHLVELEALMGAEAVDRLVAYLKARRGSGETPVQLG